jgi:serine/threonine-protein phosphatase 2A regulatory subunit A
MIDDEDEVLLELSKVLGNFLPHIGGKSNVVNLLKPLEALCTVEEGMVRETAAKSINKILSNIKVKDFEEDLVTLFSRLVKGDWFTSKISATMILPSIYPHVSGHGQKQLFKLYAPLCEDGIAQVRKAAAIALNELILYIPKAPEAELLEIFETFQKDSQDMVKMQGVDA